MGNKLLLWLLVLCSSGPLVACGDDWRQITADVVYGHKAGMALTYDVVRPAKDANGAAVLFMVSGGWVSMWQPPEKWVRAELPERANLFEQLVQRGYTMIFVRHGSSPYFKVPDAVADTKLAMRHIRQHADDYAVDAQRIGVFGGSAGGHLALVLGTLGDDGDAQASDPLLRTSNRVAAVAAYYPPTDLRAYVNHPTLSKQFPAMVFDEAVADDVSPLLAASADDAPALLIHGDKDELVPLWHSEKIKEALESEQVTCELLVMEGAAHGFNAEQTARAEAAVIEWFDRYLSK